MKKLLFALCAIILSTSTSFAQYNYEASEAHPFGQLNPEASAETADFAALIGECECTSQNRNPDGTWNDEIDMIWRWKYIMNGMAVQDETLKADSIHSGSIRQFNEESKKWFVHYYSTSGAANPLPSWEGSKTEDGNIVLYREQKAPNGSEGFYRLTFYDISEEGFEWIGEWVDSEETLSFPTWKISCKK